ncbi:hypothetical protein PoB_000319900 [Plakobranchus ocellatus]|uniref:Uncharacterized protein n=1 Tax=Plakobranchus ocellatus TaxID=259542 RepID=A0AAV3Y180_9GAST|nr:hypothetical protein PoB_000319900 [Plakobranchus ocellatus]
MSWKVIKDFPAKDQTFPQKMAPKLTKKHIKSLSFPNFMSTWQPKSSATALPTEKPFCVRQVSFQQATWLHPSFSKDSLFNSFNQSHWR